MYNWYSDAGLCITYLNDVPGAHQLKRYLPGMQRTAFEKCRWFTRGWTLQELIACKTRRFFASNWSEITNQDVGDDIVDICSRISGVSTEALRHHRKLEKFCNAERMSWASHRCTTRPEDGAYSLIGIFNVSLPIIYGEGLRKAFRRLQDEIMKNSFDQTLFAWRGHYESSGLLARSPADFANTPELSLCRSMMLTPFSMTNAGIFIGHLATKPSGPHDMQATLQCDIKTKEGWLAVNIRLQRVSGTKSYVMGQSHP